MSRVMLLVLLVLYYVRRSSDADNEGVEGRVQLQQLTGLIGLSIGPAYVRPVSCWTTFIVIQ